MKHKNQCKSVCWLFALSVLFILAGVASICAEEAEVKSIKSDIEEANRELGIMARVLEASLDRSGLAPWQPVTPGISAFDAGIKVQYIPSVCAIFTIPVNFPVFDVTKQPEQKEALQQKEPEDLWEKYVREGDQAREQLIRAEGPPRMIDPWGAVALRSADDETKQKEFLKQAEERKERLRGALLETLGRYGHRLKHLNTKEEKIVFIVQAPAPSDLSSSRLTGYANYDLLLAEVQRTKEQIDRIVVAGKPLGQVNYYILVISNAKLSAVMAVEDLTSSAAIKEYYY